VKSVNSEQLTVNGGLCRYGDGTCAQRLRGAAPVARDYGYWASITFVRSLFTVDCSLMDAHAPPGLHAL